MAQLTVVVACTSTKRVAPDAKLMVRDLPEAPLAQRLELWRKRVRGARPATALGDLYGGPTWARVADVTAAAARRGWTPSLLVASAGLGLRSVETLAPAYAATFSSGSPDLVADTDSDRVRWWRGLADLPQANSVLDLRADAFLFILSSTYATAMGNELSALAVGQRVFLVGGSQELPGVHRVPTSRSLRSSLGGTTTSLGLRTAAAWLGSASATAIGSPRHSAAWRRFVEANATPDSCDRQRLSDTAIIDLIHRLLGRQPSLSRTQALRMLRDQGVACEQGRFADLFAAAGAA